MDVETYLSLYKGRCVEINDRYGITDPHVNDDDRRKCIGLHGIVNCVESSYGHDYIGIIFDGQPNRTILCLPEEMNLLPYKTIPLPLPG